MKKLPQSGVVMITATLLRLFLLKEKRSHPWGSGLKQRQGGGVEGRDTERERGEKRGERGQEESEKRDTEREERKRQREEKREERFSTFPLRCLVVMYHLHPEGHVTSRLG